MINIIKKNKDEDFEPHMAMTHNGLNGGAANAMNKPIFLKSAKPLTKSALEAIEKLEGKEGVEKASYRNLMSMLDKAISDKMKETETDDDYGWVWLKDFDDSTAVFEYRNTVYGVDYLISDTGIITLSTELREVISQEIYVTDDGKSLVLKYKNSSNSGEDIATGTHPEGKENMSKELELQIATLTKAAEDQEAKTGLLIEKALAKQTEDLAKAALVNDVTEVFKGFESIDANDQVELVKSIVSLGEGGSLVIKALTDMQELVKASKEATKIAEDSAEEIKKEFGTKEDEGIEGAAVDLTKAVSMKERVAATLAAKNKQ